MRRVIKVLAITATSLGLFSCAAFHREAAVGSDAYLKKSQTIPATQIPKTVASNVPMQTYYPIPPVSMAPVMQPPSTVPPGSQQPMPLQTATVQQNSVIAAFSSTALVLNMNYSQAWPAVGKALRGSGYKVMQQDNSLGAYFVLDLAGTGGKLKSDTPIYQVHLKSLGNTTSVTVMNAQNQPADPGVSGRILGALKRGL